MKNEPYFASKLLKELDSFLHKNDYESAEAYLLRRLNKAEATQDFKTEILIRNELMGLYRKCGKREKALDSVNAAIKLIESNNLQNQVGSATTFLNCATVYKAFGMADFSLPLFLRAKDIYERELSSNDSRLGGLYNNMGLTLVDLKRYREANELYQKAINIMKTAQNGALEVAITYLNMASCAEAELGLSEADETISMYLKKAEELLEGHKNRDGYYAFVCEKCASVFGYYGYFAYEKELSERARRIYEGT